MYKSENADSDQSRYFEIVDIWQARKCSRSERKTHSTLPRESAAGKNKTVPLALIPISDKHESGSHMEYARDNSQVRCDAAVSIEGKNLNFKEAHPDDDKFG